MRILTVAVLLTLWCAGVTMRAEESAAKQGITLPDQLNARVRPDMDASVGAVLEKNSRVEVLEARGNWFKIRMPKNGAVWIALPYLDEKRIPEQGAKLRAGPSVAYDEYGMAGRSPVEILERSRNKKWARIKPPDGLALYVKSEYVKLNETEGNSRDVPEEMEALPSEIDAVSGYERMVLLEGIVMPLKGDPAGNHVLAIRINRKYYPLAYLESQREKLKLWEGRSVRVEGPQHWPDDRSRPHILVQKITPAWQQPDGNQ